MDKHYVCLKMEYIEPFWTDKLVCCVSSLHRLIINPSI